MNTSDCYSNCSVSTFADKRTFSNGATGYVFNLSKCIIEGAHCYFNCTGLFKKNPNPKAVTDYNLYAQSNINNLIDIGRAGAITSIVASCLFILISVYLKRYRRWIERIILSKVACDLIYSIVLMDQFNFRPLLQRKFLTHFLLIVVSLLGLVWIPVLFFEVRNVITFPFSGYGLSKLVTRWSIALYRMVLYVFHWKFVRN